MSEIWNLSALCRCCHSDGNFESLRSLYSGNDLETYSSKLLETLGIEILPPPFEASYTICDPCIVKLRDATNFKNLVLSCERKFDEYCKNEMSLKLNTDNIKVESDDYNEDGNSHNDGYIFHDHDSGDDGGDKSKLNLWTPKQESILDIKTLGKDDSKDDTKALISLEPFENKTIDNGIQKTSLPTRNAADQTPKKSKLITTKANSTKKVNGAKKTIVKHSKSSEEIKSKPRIRVREPKVEKRKQADTSQTYFYKCKLCKMKFSVEKNLKSHVISMHIKNFKCDYCAEVMNYKRSFLKHLRTHRDDRVYNCKLCDKTYNNAFAAYKHQSEHSNPTFTCDLCKKDFRYRCTLRKHMLWHFGWNKKVLCDLCGHSFNDKTNLLKHIQTVHEKLRPHKCSVCSKKFSTNRHLVNHFRNSHEGYVPFKCDVCERTYSSQLSMEIHALKHDNKYKCRSCRVIFDDRSLYLSHLSVHKSAKPRTKLFKENIIGAHVKCELCGHYFASKFSLRRHMSVHSDVKEFSCDLCNSNFTQKESLTRHIKRAHGPKSKKKLVKCTVCNRNSSDLEKHMRSHTNRPYNCDYCQKVYSKANALNRHVREVHFGTIHECDLCGKTYNLLKSLRSHKLNVHKVSWRTEVKCAPEVKIE